MGRPGRVVEARVRRVRGGRVEEVEDLLAAEEPLEIRLVPPGGPPRPLVVTMRTPGNDFELAAGFLFTEGIVRRREEIERIAYCVDPGVAQEYNIVSVHVGPGVDAAVAPRAFSTTSACGVCGKASIDAVRIRGIPPMAAAEPRVAPGLLGLLPDRLREGQRIFARTGGLHAAGLFDAAGKLLSLREDVGRHNAVDKLVGEQLLADRIPLGGHLLVVSGRAGFEIVQKAAVAGIPFVVAVGAPSSLAVDLARELGMSLVGFARSGGFNIYAGAQRIAPGGAP